jgi:hypothetical protein
MVLFFLLAASTCSERLLFDDNLRVCLDSVETRAETLAAVERQIHTSEREDLLAMLRSVVLTDDAELRAALVTILLREKALGAKAVAAIPTRTRLQKAIAAADKRVDGSECRLEANMEIVCQHRFCRPGCIVMEARLRYKTSADGLTLLEAKEVSHGDTGECGCCMLRQ